MTLDFFGFMTETTLMIVNKADFEIYFDLLDKFVLLLQENNLENTNAYLKLHFIEISKFTTLTLVKNSLFEINEKNSCM